MSTVYSVAKEICKKRNWTITNLELQKLLYILQVLFIGKTGKPLFEEPFEAWDYGPVLPAIYHKLKMFGNKPIQSWIFFDVPDEQENLDVIHNFVDATKNLSPSQLVALTHRKGTAWYKNYNPKEMSKKISLNDMKEEFKDVWKEK